MQIELSTDSSIQGSIELKNEIAAEIEKSLGRFSDWVTRIEVHLSDSNSSAKGGSTDKRCGLEARPANRQPLKVSHEAASFEQAYKGAVKKMLRVLDDTQTKHRPGKGDVSFAGDQSI